jgi:hypothetical protein
MHAVSYPDFAGWGGHAAPIVLFGAMAIGAFVYCVRFSRRERQLWPLSVYGGSLLLVVYEPFNNLLAHCAYPAGGPTILSYLGQHIPVSTWMIYIFYFSVAVPLLLKKLEDGLTMRQMWRYYAIAVAICAAFEPLFANPHLGIRWWYYYGDNQALNFTGMPMFWWFANAMVVCSTAMIFQLLRRHVLRSDRESLLFIPLEPLLLFGVHGSAAIPVYVAITSAGSKWLTALATIGSIAISFLYMSLLGRATTVPVPEPAGAPARIWTPVRPAERRLVA